MEETFSLTTSVVIATYNGALYIREQIESIVQQSITPNEIIISDDWSTDNTFSVATEALSQSNIPFTIVKNKYERGVANNFSCALEIAKNDIVFISDQDDVWLKDKIKEVLQVFSRTNAELVIHDSFVTWENESKPISRISDELKKLRIEAAGNSYGCMMSVKRSLLETVLPIAGYSIEHDLLLSFIASCRKSKIYYEKPLMIYRRHNSNVSKKLFYQARQRKSLSSTLSNILDYSWLQNRYSFVSRCYRLATTRSDQGTEVLSEKQLNDLTNEIQRLTLRHESMFSSSIPKILGNSWLYIRYQIPFHTWLKDVTVKMAMKFISTASEAKDE
jgi:glycosyltransferase involved in cell wall biosynthesis